MNKRRGINRRSVDKSVSEVEDPPTYEKPTPPSGDSSGRGRTPAAQARERLRGKTQNGWAGATRSPKAHKKSRPKGGSKGRARAQNP
eukprot:6523892-Alexandrium_andersonii.AAC.1